MGKNIEKIRAVILWLFGALIAYVKGRRDQKTKDDAELDRAEKEAQDAIEAESGRQWMARQRRKAMYDKARKILGKLGDNRNNRL
jgi:L-fucose mutarotase/ribose pyranase (RbsD/FucU family)